MIFTIVQGCATISPLTVLRENPADTLNAGQAAETKVKKLRPSFTLHVPIAPHVAVPMHPAGTYDLDPNDGGFGLGVAIDYTIMPGLRHVLDGTTSNYKRLVAEHMSQSTSEWIFEMMDYSAVVDFHIKESSAGKDLFIVTLFGEAASPVVNPEFNDLFYTGWTWPNSGGNHIMGPCRIGLALSF